LPKPIVDKQGRKDATRSRILDAAARMFNENGFAATSLRDIAAAADMKAGSLYYHFDSKEDIVAEVLDLGIRNVHEAVEAAVAGLPGNSDSRRKIRTAIAAHLEALLAHGDYTSANIRIFGQVPAEVRKRNMAVRDAYEKLWLNLFEQAQADGTIRKDVNPNILKLFLLAALNSPVEWYRTDRLPVAELARLLADYTLHGAAVPEKGTGN